MTCFHSFAELKAWFAGKESEGDSSTEPPTTGPEEPGDDLPSGPCLNGDEHDVVEIRAATAKEPLQRYCRVCRVGL
jgi:hypothetical protein